jgi:protein O-mannose beta-1,4-N-acetylglucosaminyltransferase
MTLRPLFLSCERQCQITNLYYHPQVDQFFVVKGNRTIYVNVPEDRNEVLVDMSSLSDHGVFTMNFSEVPEHLLTLKTLALVEDRTYLLMRFHAGNIMHCMHDDVLGIYFHLKMNAPPVRLPPGADYNGDDVAPFSRDHNLMFVDGFGEGSYGHIFKFMTNYPLRFKADMPKDKITCFQDAVVGQSKQANWYHYGFAEPQGPIPNKRVDGSHVREVAAYIMKQLGFPIWDRHAAKRNLAYLRAMAEKNAQAQNLHLLRGR